MSSSVVAGGISAMVSEVMGCGILTSEFWDLHHIHQWSPVIRALLGFTFGYLGWRTDNSVKDKKSRNVDQCPT